MKHGLEADHFLLMELHYTRDVEWRETKERWNPSTDRPAHHSYSLVTKCNLKKRDERRIAMHGNVYFSIRASPSQMRYTLV